MDVTKEELGETIAPYSASKQSGADMIFDIGEFQPRPLTGQVRDGTCQCVTRQLDAGLHHFQDKTGADDCSRGRKSAVAVKLPCEY